MHLSLASRLTQCCDISTGQERRDLHGDLRWSKEDALGADESGDRIDEHVERWPPHVESEQYVGRDKDRPGRVDPFVVRIVRGTDEENVNVGELGELGEEEVTAPVTVRLYDDEERQLVQREHRIATIRPVTGELRRSRTLARSIEGAWA